MPQTLPVETQIVVTMFGGSAQSVAVVGDDVKITDVVFLEDKQYVWEMTEDCYRVKNADGSLSDCFIFTHMTGVDVITEEEFERIREASEARANEVPEADWETADAN